MPSYNIVEPHPTPATPVIHVGRGGSGNVSRLRSQNLTYGPSASGPASKVPLPGPSRHAYMGGRGGAGNLYRDKERGIFSFDEELAAQERLTDGAAPVYHVGRGGAGNVIDERVPGSSIFGGSRRSNSTNSYDSSQSGPHPDEKKRGALEGALRSLSKTFSRV